MTLKVPLVPAGACSSSGNAVEVTVGAMGLYGSTWKVHVGDQAEVAVPLLALTCQLTDAGEVIADRKADASGTRCVDAP